MMHSGCAARRPASAFHLALIASLAFAPICSLQARMWLDISGAFRVEADIVQILDHAVLLKTKDGREVRVDITRLSTDDQNFIASSRVAARLKGNKQYILETEPGEFVTATYTYTAIVPELKAMEWSLIAAHPPELPSQSKITFSMSPAGEGARDQSQHARAISIARITVDGGKHEHSMKTELKIRAQLFARTLVPRLHNSNQKPQVDVLLPEAERARYLEPTDLAAHESSEFQQWLDESQLRAKPGEGQVDFARRAFLHLRKKFTYEYTDKMDRQATAVCKAGKSDCGGLSIVMCCVLRSNGVPARLLVGRWAFSDDDEDAQQVAGVPYHQQHVKMEFFADGVGWVPLDLSSSILHDKSWDGLRFFGSDPGDFITMHVESDIAVDTRLFGNQTVPWLQGVAFWVSGRGTMDNRSAEESWIVTVPAATK